MCVAREFSVVVLASSVWFSVRVTRLRFFTICRTKASELQSVAASPTSAASPISAARPVYPSCKGLVWGFVTTVGCCRAAVRPMYPSCIGLVRVWLGFSQALVRLWLGFRIVRGKYGSQQR